MKDRSSLIGASALIIIGILVYLPLVRYIGYTHDDWYLMASAGAEGAGIFHEIYSVDRPLRAYVLELAYALFGQNVLFYNLSAWVFRVLSAILFWWLLQMLWSRHLGWTLLMAILYVIYPGFLSQYNGIDYLPQMVSLSLAMLSLALTVIVYFQKNSLYKIAGIALAILSGILYLGLVEYEAGFELMRLAILFILVSRTVFTHRERIVATIKAWLSYSLVLLAFGFWRVFIFQSERGATDIGVQFEQARLYPLQTMYGWLVQVVQDFFDITIAAWVIPLSQLTDYILTWGGALAIILTTLMLTVFNIIKKDEDQVESSQPGVVREALWLGFVTAVGGLIPIALVNREVYFPSFSRYALMSSFGVAIFTVAFLMRLNGGALRNKFLGLLLLVASLTHHANAVKHARETAVLNNFWWQVSWRVPQFEKNTTLIANIPGVATEEDYFVWGPASLIYYPESQNAEVLQPGLFAAVLNNATVTKVLTRERQEYDNRRGIITYKNYRNILILTQPSANSCVHVINGLQPEFSNAQSDSIRVIGSYSEIGHVLVDETPHAPPEIVFGPEPARDWCYYYQKADLARQRGEWESIVGLGNEAQANSLSPSDAIEWMPFLQAYAVTNNIDRLMELAPTIGAEPYVFLQACRIMGSMQGLSQDVIEVIDSYYCLE